MADKAKVENGLFKNGTTLGVQTSGKKPWPLHLKLTIDPGSGIYSLCVIILPCTLMPSSSHYSSPLVLLLSTDTQNLQFNHDRTATESGDDWEQKPLGTGSRLLGQQALMHTGP